MSNIERKKLAKGTKLAAQPISDFITDIEDNINSPSIDIENLPYRSNFDLTFNTRILKNNKDTGWTVFGDMDVTTGVITKHAGDMGSPRKLLVPVDDGYPEQYVWQHFHFILPNCQDVFDIDGMTNQSYVYSLNRVVIGVDTLDNPAGTHPTITDPTYTPVGTYHSLAGTDSMNITVSLYRKTNFTNSGTEFWEEKIGEWIVPGTAFLNSGLDTNPLSFEDLKIKIFPDSVYMLAITSNNTEETLQIDFGTGEPQTLLINNLQINLGFSCQLLDFDTVQVSEVGAIPTIQNAPASDQLSPWILQGTVVVNPPSPLDQITETNLQGNLAAIDKPIVRKLLGGYETDASAPHHRQVQTSACYEVKQIPIMNNNQMLYTYKKKKENVLDPWQLFATKPGFSLSCSGLFPYSTINPYSIDWNNYQPQELGFGMGDRKFLPIHEPFTIHHMMFTYWLGDPTILDGDRPELSTTRFRLQVFLHTLDRSDSIIRQQIGYANWQPTIGTDIVTGQSLLVDKANWLEQQNSPTYKNNPNIQPCGFTIQIPLNYGTTTNKQGVGYTRTGKPFFYGQGNYPYSAYGSRVSYFRDINDDTLVQYLQGHEQFLEVVFFIEANIPSIGPFTTQESPPPEEPNYTIPALYETGTILQQPGAMFYLLGKKSLVDSRGNH